LRRGGRGRYARLLVFGRSRGRRRWKEQATQIDGFTATTRVSAMVQGQYTAQVTRQLPAIQGAVAGTPSVAAKASKQAVIGALPTPSFLADVK